MAVDAALHRVDVHERQHVRAGQQRRLPGQLASSSRPAAPCWRTLPQVNERRNDPSVDGARTPPNSSGIAPCRSRPMSSIESAPAAMPATRQPTFTSGYTPVLAAIVTWWRTRDSSPARSASAITGTSPAGGAVPSFQKVGKLPEATWPDGPVPQQLHLDTTVPTEADLDVAHERALALGARLLYNRSDDPEEPLRVYADPAGHPFCIIAAL